MKKRVEINSYYQVALSASRDRIKEHVFFIIVTKQLLLFHNNFMEKDKMPNTVASVSVFLYKDDR